MNYFFKFVTRHFFLLLSIVILLWLSINAIGAPDHGSKLCIYDKQNKDKCNLKFTQYSFLGISGLLISVTLITGLIFMYINKTKL